LLLLARPLMTWTQPPSPVHPGWVSCTPLACGLKQEDLPATAGRRNLSLPSSHNQTPQMTTTPAVQFWRNPHPLEMTEHQARRKFPNSTCSIYFFFHSMLVSSLCLSFRKALPSLFTLCYKSWFPCWSGQAFCWDCSKHYVIFQFLGWWLHAHGPPQTVTSYVNFYFMNE